MICPATVSVLDIPVNCNKDNGYKELCKKVFFIFNIRNVLFVIYPMLSRSFEKQIN